VATSALWRHAYYWAHCIMMRHHFLFRHAVKTWGEHYFELPSLKSTKLSTSASHASQSSSETSTLANTDTKLQRLIGLEDHRRRGTDNTVQWALSLLNLDPSLWGVNVRPFSGYLPCQLCSLHGLTPTTRSYYVTYLWVIIWHMGFKHPRGKLALPLSTLNPCHMLSTLWLAWCTMMV